MKKAPCARLGMRISPKISEKPDDRRNSRPPKATLLSVWMIQNCHCIDCSQPTPVTPTACQASTTAASAKLESFWLVAGVVNSGGELGALPLPAERVGVRGILQKVALRRGPHPTPLCSLG